MEPKDEQGRAQIHRKLRPMRMPPRPPVGPAMPPRTKRTPGKSREPARLARLT